LNPLFPTYTSLSSTNPSHPSSFIVYPHIHLAQPSSRKQTAPSGDLVGLVLWLAPIIRHTLAISSLPTSPSLDLVLVLAFASIRFAARPSHSLQAKTLSPLAFSIHFWFRGG